MQEKEKIIIKSESHPYNMASWVLEKSENVLTELVRMAEMLKNKELKFETCEKMIDYPETAEERFIGDLKVALYDQLKIYSFLIGQNWDPEYASWIINGGEEGYEKVLVSMNQLEETTKDRKKSALMELFKGLISEDLNRTRVHDLLWNCRRQGVHITPDIEKVQAEVERWTMGEITEAEFKENIRFNIVNIQSYLENF